MKRNICIVFGLFFIMSQVSGGQLTPARMIYAPDVGAFRGAARLVYADIKAEATTHTIQIQLRAGDGVTTQTSGVQVHTGAAQTYHMVINNLPLKFNAYQVSAYFDLTDQSAAKQSAYFIGAFLCPHPLDLFIAPSIAPATFNWDLPTSMACTGDTPAQLQYFRSRLARFGVIVQNHLNTRARMQIGQQQNLINDPSSN